MNAPRRNWFEQRRFGDILVRVDTAALGGLCLVLLVVEFVQRGTVA